MSGTNPERNRRVLVIDDKESIHSDFRKILSPDDPTRASLDITETALFGGPLNEDQQPQFEIDSAYQGPEGLMRVEEALAAGRPYAMVFVDMRMPPGWDGITTAQKLLEIDLEIQIVLCTAYSAYSEDEISEQLGNSGRMIMLNKPFDTAQALRLVNELTEKWWLVHSDIKTTHRLALKNKRIKE
jgi:two-component system, NtrC family, sensor kinase